MQSITDLAANYAPVPSADLLIFKIPSTLKMERMRHQAVPTTAKSTVNSMNSTDSVEQKTFTVNPPVNAGFLLRYPLDDFIDLSPIACLRCCKCLEKTKTLQEFGKEYSYTHHRLDVILLIDSLCDLLIIDLQN
jgi:hypothetical protein